MPSDDFIPRGSTTQQAAPTPQAIGPDFIPRIRTKSTASPEIQQMVEEEMPGVKETLATGAHALPFLLGTGGAFLGGPAGAAVGSAAGSLADASLNSEDPLTPGQVAKTAAISGLGTYAGGKLLGPVEGKLATALVNTLFAKGMKTAQGDPGPQGLDNQVLDLGKDFASNLVLDAGGKFLVKGLIKKPGEEGVPLGTEAARQREQLRIGGEGPTTEHGTPPSSTAELGGSARTTAVANRNQAKAMEDRAFEIFRRQHAEANALKVQKLDHYEEGKVINPATGKADPVAVTKEVTINGPIYTAQTQLAAQEMMPQFDGFLKGESFQQLPDQIKTKYQRLASYVKDLSESTSILHNGKEADIPVKEFEAIKQAKTEINKAVGGKPGPNYPETGLIKLAKALDVDIDTSINQFWKDGPKAQAALETANRATQIRKSTFDTKENQKRVFGSFESGRTDTRIPGDNSQFFKEAYKSPEKAGRLIKTLESQGPEGSADFKQDYFDNQLLRNSFGADGTKYNPSKMIEMLEDPNGVGRVILTAPERNNLLRFARAAQAAGEDDTRAPSAVATAGEKVLISLGVAASRIATGSVAPARVAIAAKDFMQTIREKPQLGEVSGRLLKVRPESLEAQAQMKLVLKSLKGLPITVTANGTTREATIGDGGKIKFGSVSEQE